MRNALWPRFLWAANPPPALTERALHQAASRTIGVPVSDALAFEIKDLAENLEALRERIKTIEGEVVRAAEGLPGYALLLSIPGIGPTLAAVLLAETGDIRWYEKPSQLRKLAGLDIVRVQSGDSPAHPAFPGAGGRFFGGRSTRRPWARPGQRASGRSERG